MGFIGRCGLGRLGLLRAGRHGKQLAPPVRCWRRDGRWRTIVVADAMQILGQHVRQEAPNKLMNKFRELGFVEYNGGLSVQSSLMNVVLHD